MDDRSPQPHEGPVRASWERRCLAAAKAYAEVLGEFQPVGPDGASSEFLVALDTEMNRITAGRIAVAGAWDAHGTWAIDGARSGAAWLASHTEQGRSRAKVELLVARRLRSMPTTEKRFADGSLGFDTVRLLADVAGELPDQFAEHEAFLVDEVQALTVDEASRFLRVWRAFADPDHGSADADRLHAKRGVHLSQTFGGMWRLDGLLDPEQGEVVNNALQHFAAQIYRAHAATAEALGEPIESTPAQRRADALVEVANAALANTQGPAVPSIIAMIDADTLCATDLPDTAIVGETDGGTPVTARTARRMACDCSISRLVHHGASLPTDLGRSERLASPAMRTALRVRDHGCTFPGCDLPHRFTEAHHIDWWEHGGDTSLRNLTSLCSHHHHEIHKRRFAVRRIADDTLVFTRPDGTPLSVPKGKAPPPTAGWPHAA